MDREGCAAANAAAGPDTANVRRPTLATFGFPITGAASKLEPTAASSRPTRSESFADTVEQSTTMDGARPPDVTPYGPITASTRSCEVPTVTNRMSTVARSEAVSTTFAPACASGSALALVLL